MAKAVFLDYSFLFNPKDTWQNLHQFETDLQKFLKSKGLRAEIISPVSGSGLTRMVVQEPVLTGKRAILVTKAPVLGPAPKPQGQKKENLIKQAREVKVKKLQRMDTRSMPKSRMVMKKQQKKASMLEHKPGRKVSKRFKTNLR